MPIVQHKQKGGGEMNDDATMLKCETAERYLKGIGTMHMRVQAYQSMMDDMYDTLRATAYDKSGSALGKTDGVFNAVAKAQETVEKHAEALASYIEAVSEANAMLEKVENHLHVNILVGRYILNRTWTDIEKETGYSHSRMMDVRKEALCEFYEVMPDHGFPSAF